MIDDDNGSPRHQQSKSVEIKLLQRPVWKRAKTSLPSRKAFRAVLCQVTDTIESVTAQLFHACIAKLSPEALCFVNTSLQLNSHSWSKRSPPALPSIHINETALLAEWGCRCTMLWQKHSVIRHHPTMHCAGESCMGKGTLLVELFLSPCWGDLCSDMIQHCFIRQVPVWRGVV